MRVGMALLRAVGYIVALLVIYFNLENQGYKESLNAAHEELMGAKESHTHLREKRETTLNSTEYLFEVVLSLSDLESLQTLLNTLTFPLVINSTAEITDIDTTTVCSSNMSRYQCRCEQNFAWSYNNCITYGACDPIIADTCGCISALPDDGQYCQPNTSLTETTTPAPSPTPTPLNDPVDIEVVLDVRVPVSSVPSSFIYIFRDSVRTFPLPFTITDSIKITSVNFTTGCYPNSTGGLQCQCEDQFAWSCDKCAIYGACSNVSMHTCGCINALPPDGQFCEPITNVSHCPTPTTPVTTTTTTPMTTTTTPTTSTPPINPVDIEVVLDVRVPVSSVPSTFIDIFRDSVRTFPLPFTITDSIKITSVNFTTGCYPNSTGGLQCQCEDQFAWSCDKCAIYGACSNVSMHTCGCINALPPDGQFCEPITNVSHCPTPTTPVTTPTTTPMTTTTTPTTSTPPINPVDIEVVLDVRVPVSSVPSTFIDIFRNSVRTFPLPFTITDSIKITSVNFTTGCYPNSTGGLQCQCEDQFAWSCDKCAIYGACSNVSMHTCGCINALPPDGQFCEPITNVSHCPTPTTPVTTPTTTPMTTTTTPTTSTPPINPVDIEVVLDVRVPVSSVPSNFTDIFRESVRTFMLPFNITDSIKITSVNFTTGCYPNSTGGLQCQCEDQFAWSCDKCAIYGACSNVSMHTCGCINALPPDGQFCEPITNVSHCPTPTTPVTTTTTTTTPLTTTTTPVTMTTTPVTTTTTPTTFTPPINPVDIDIVLDIRVPVSSVPLNFIDIFRNSVRTFRLPFNITDSTNITSVNFTTGCCPKSTGGLQCQCEDQFAWSCDKCAIYGACSNVSMHTCGCINALPPDGQFCEPIASVAVCPPMNTTAAPVTRNTTAMKNTTLITTPMKTTTAMMNTTLITTPMKTTTAMMNTTLITTPMNMTTKSVNTTTVPMTRNTTAITTTTPPPTTQKPTAISTTTLPPTTQKPAPMMTTTQKPTTTTTSQTVPVVARNLTFTMDMDFSKAFNDKNNPVYINTLKAIQEQSNKHITGLASTPLLSFRSGSTIAEYTLTAPSFDETEILEVRKGIFNDLASLYPVIFDSPNTFEFEPTEVFFGRSANFTCGPPPQDLTFSLTWTPQWRRNNEEVPEDREHVFTEQNGRAVLTLTKSFKTDNGLYECWLKDINQPGSVFRQRSKEALFVKDRPIVRVNNIRQSIECEVGKTVVLECSVEAPYQVQFIIPDSDTNEVITYQYTIQDCDNNEVKFICQVKDHPEFNREITLVLLNKAFDCEDDAVFGNGFLNERGVASCKEDEVGEKTAVCRTEGWSDIQDGCVLRPVQELLEQSEFLTAESLPQFLDQLSNVTLSLSGRVVESSANINAIVDILNNVAITTSSLQINVTRILMEDILLTVGVLTTDGAKNTWTAINTNDTRNISATRSNTAESVSSTLLQSVENITSDLTNDSFNINTDFIRLNKTTFTNSFEADFNSSVEIIIPESNEESQSITVITFASLDNVLPARDQDNSSNKFINGRVVLVQSSGQVNNVSFSFDFLNNTLEDPQCVFWNFSLFDGLGGWDDEGCVLVNNNETATCNCNHLTSFSILMSPFAPDDLALALITYIGVAISMASLVICLIIEGVIWRKIRKNNTSYLRHVSIVNIAVSLLIADIWFIIGAAISDKPVQDKAACSAATFFIHFFYLALFFWMLASALLLFYRTVSVFDGGLTKTSMLAIGFSIGYGAPLIIAVITVAVTAPRRYIQDSGVCWLNWFQSKALLAFVIPALLIVFINLLILIVVIYKMLRRRVVGDAAQAAERHVLVVILRSLAVLTPFFGLTWSLGVGTMTNPRNRGIHISFAFFNSLQGFFILVFGTLLDKKVRSEIAIKSQISSSATRSTSAGNSSSSGLGFLRNLRRGRDGYNLSSSGAGESNSFSNT